MVDILFLSKNRKEFTEASLAALIANTNWELVNSLWLYGDAAGIPQSLQVPNIVGIGEDYGSPVAITNNFLDRSPTLSTGPADIFVKVDNDLILCPGWLECGIGLMREHPEVDLLGIEPHRTLDIYALDALSENGGTVIHGIRTTDHIGGIGFFRRRAFAGRTRPQPNGRYGFTEWQWANPDIVKAWINPPMPVFLLDHLPREPWRTLSREYEAKGWQRRQWGEYEERSSKLWDWWVKQNAR